MESNSSFWNPGAKYVSSKMLRQFQNLSVFFGNRSAIKTAKDSAETFAYYVDSEFGIPWLYIVYLWHT